MLPSIYRFLMPALAPAGLLAALAGCGATAVSTPAVTVAPNPFANVVALGDSGSAGFQNDSLLDTQQPHGFLSLVASKAGFALTLPLVGPPGIGPVLTLESATFPPVLGHASGTSAGRDDPTVQPTDLAVPGYTVHQLINTAPSPSNHDTYTNLILGLPAGNTNTELQEAIALKPTTIFLWIGANDARGALDAGSPSGMTSLAAFTSDFTQLMTSLKANTTAHLVVGNLPDITLLPYMTPATEVMAWAAAHTGLTAAAASAQLSLAAGDLVNPTGLGDMFRTVASFQQSGVLTPLAPSDVLTAAEIVTVQAMIASYNQVIAQQVAVAGGTLVDIHSFFATLSAGISINGYTATTGYLGGLFSLDGAHTTNTGYALLANAYIAALNQAFSLAIPVVDVNAVAASDPYFGPNIQPVAGVARSTLLAQVRQACRHRPPAGM